MLSVLFEQLFKIISIGEFWNNLKDKSGKTFEFHEQTNERESKMIIKAFNQDLLCNISKYVDKFTDVYCSDNNGRYLSYDHIRSNFLKYRKDESKKELITLYLYAYLASWGMLRNSFLMQKDYKFLMPVIAVLSSEKIRFFIKFCPV